VALISAMHITAGVYVNDAEPGLIADIDGWLEGLAPFREGIATIVRAEAMATPI